MEGRALMIKTPAELLAALADLEAVIGAEDDGRFLIRVPMSVPGDVQRACRRWKWVIAWGVHGADQSLRWFVCLV